MKKVMQWAAFLALSSVSALAAQANVGFSQMISVDDATLPQLGDASRVAGPVDVGLEVGRTMEIAAVQKPSITLAPEELHLSLRPTNSFVTRADLVLGRGTPFASHAVFGVFSGVFASTPDEAEWRFLRYGVLGAEGLDKFGEMFDVDETERPWSTTTNVHVLAPTHDWLVPFATVAHEVDSLDQFERYGFGGGTLINIDEHTTFGTEILYFGDQSDYNDTLSRETRLIARLQIEF